MFSSSLVLGVFSVFIIFLFVAQFAVCCLPDTSVCGAFSPNLFVSHLVSGLSVRICIELCTIADVYSMWFFVSDTTSSVL